MPALLRTPHRWGSAWPKPGNVKLYHGAQHEVLNEINDVVRSLRRVLGA